MGNFTTSNVLSAANHDCISYFRQSISVLMLAEAQAERRLKRFLHGYRSKKDFFTERKTKHSKSIHEISCDSNSNIESMLKTHMKQNLIV